MPRSIIARNKLGDSAIALDQKVSSHLHTGDIGKVRMLISIQTVLKKLMNMAAAKLTWRQADVMNHQKRHFSQRTLIEVW